MRRISSAVATRCLNKTASLGITATATSTTRGSANKVPERMPLHLYDEFLSGTSAAYLESVLEDYRADPNSVDPQFRAIFESMQGTPYDAAVLHHPLKQVVAEANVHEELQQNYGLEASVQDARLIISLIRAYESHGHLFAKLNPLSTIHDEQGETAVESRVPSTKALLALHHTAFDLTDADLDPKFAVGFHNGLGGFFDVGSAPISLRDLIERLKECYCGRIGYEFMHVYDENVCHWIREHVESPNRIVNNPLINKIDHSALYYDLAQSVEFENFLKTKFHPAKRFGSDGSESFLVGMKALLERAGALGFREVIMGQAHRGRLNLLANVCGKPLEALLMEFRGLQEEDVLDPTMSFDVKYHLGSRQTITLRNGKEITVELLNNPSHLEAVNPLVQGYTRSAQRQRMVSGQGHTPAEVLPIEIHGDAAVAGQGVVYETMGLSDIGKFGTGGTIHVVVNNQIGFTTNPIDSRSSTHCSDLARVFQCPVLHVNGDSPEDVARVFQLAADYRRTFARSIVIDLVCYRRYGHNEGDSPSFTQPIMYQIIDKRKDVLTLYTEEILEKPTPVLSKELMDTMRKEIRGKLRDAFSTVEKKAFNYKEYQKSIVMDVWKPFMFREAEKAEMKPTAVPKADLDYIARFLKVGSFPEGFEVHKTLKDIFKRREVSLETGQGLEWSTCEALAVGTLARQFGYKIRVSGQDVERGTFSQRHAVVHDQNPAMEEDNIHIPLKAALHDAPHLITFTNTALNEYAVLGFEIGYALRDPSNFIMWEAQFGDFANGAQIAIDQFLVSSMSKWSQPCSTILSLPHGYDGNGPEHSSGRIERFLQASNETEETGHKPLAIRHFETNICVAQPTTPKQYFHILRRHMLRNFRRPLIIFWSKQYLRAPNVSSMAELTNGHFETVIPNTDPNAVEDGKMRRVVLCTGQVYFMLEKERASRRAHDIALVRVEELTPLPLAEIQAEVKRYPNAGVMWAQEEPRNMGAFLFLQPHLEDMSKDGECKYAGRLSSPSVATGSRVIHNTENQMIIEAVFEA